MKQMQKNMEVMEVKFENQIKQIEKSIADKVENQIKQSQEKIEEKLAGIERCLTRALNIPDEEP